MCQAQSATLTIAEAFNLAYESWQAARDTRKRKEKRQEGRRKEECSCEKKKNDTAVNDKIVNTCADKDSEEKVVEQSPNSGFNNSMVDDDAKDAVKEDVLLIDLASPEAENTWQSVRIQGHQEQEEDMDQSFTE